MNTKRIKAVLAVLAMVIVPCVILFSGVSTCIRFNKSDSTSNNSYSDATNQDPSNAENSGEAMGEIKNVFSNDNKVSYQKACEDLDFAVAHEILDKLRTSAVKIPLVFGKVSTKYNEYESADMYIFKQECAYLMESGLDGAERMIIKLISDTPFDGTKINEGDYKGDDIYNNLSNDKGNESLYLHCINRFNKKCDYALEIANALNKKELMGDLIRLYKDNIIFEKIKRSKSFDGFVGEAAEDLFGISKKETWSSISYETRDKDAAISRYNLVSANTITLQSTKITGPLGKYFEVVSNEKGYNIVREIDRHDDKSYYITVEIKRIKAGALNNYDLSWTMTDDNNSVVLEDYYWFGNTSGLFSVEVGETYYCRIKLSDYERNIRQYENLYLRLSSSKHRGYY